MTNVDYLTQLTRTFCYKKQKDNWIVMLNLKTQIKKLQNRLNPCLSRFIKKKALPPACSEKEIAMMMP